MTIASLLDRAAIAEQITRYFRAIDRCDRPLLESVFHEDSQHDHGPYQGPSREFCDFAFDLLKKLDRTHHQLGNILIDLLDETHAISETYATAYHRIGAGVQEAAFPDHDLSLAEDLWIGLRYHDYWEKLQGQWKIAKRYGIHDWVRWAPAADRGFADVPASQRGQRSPLDRSYHIAVGGDSYALLHRGRTLKGV
jgi:hypothetical protein